MLAETPYSLNIQDFVHEVLQSIFSCVIPSSPYRHKENRREARELNPVIIVIKKKSLKIQPFPQMDQQPVNQLVLPIPRGGFHRSIFFYYASTVEFLFCLAGQSGIQSIM